MAKYSREKVIEQFKSIHGDTYDYSLVEYLGDTTKVKIICSKHGIFEQWVQGHKKGSGCRQCAITSLKPKYTTEQIIEQFKKKHGDKFDYSEVNYTNSSKKVRIICRIHGEFEQLVQAHRRGQGCAKCMYDDKRNSSEHIIEEFKKTHKNTYDYSKVKYKNIDSHVEIICETHGIFLQTPWQHIKGNGCPKCIGRNKNQDEILLEFTEIHGEKYDYSKVDFKQVTKKVKIYCKKHGFFLQTPSKHISGQGCPKCGGAVAYTQEEVIRDFIKTHGDRYDYSLVKYKSNKHKVKIKCKDHGLFLQQPDLHRKGMGCAKCAGNYNLETGSVIEQFKEIHSDRYDYTKTNYKNAYTEVVITCREHGDFYQTPKSHKKGSGCPECAVTIGHTKDSYLEYCKKHDGKTHLYLVRCFSEDEEFYKIGISRLGANVRFDSKRKLPYEFEVIEEVLGDASMIWDLEKSVHKLLYKQKYKPKLEFHGKTECFSKIPKKVLKLIEEFQNSNQLMLVV